MPSSKRHDPITTTSSAQTPAQGMVAESMREKLSALSRQQNRALIISIVSRWVVICVVCTALVLLIAYYFSSNASSSALFQKTIFSAWVLGIFLSSFWSIYTFLANKKSEKEFIHSIEKQIPDLEQRLITSAEFAYKEESLNNNATGTSKEFLEQLHVDAKSKVDSQPFQIHFSKNSYQNSLLAAFAAVVFFSVSLDLSKGFRESTRFLVWPKALHDPTVADGQVSENNIIALAPTDISVQPGDIEMQRGEDLVITAVVDNASPKSLTLFTQDDQLNWRQIKMLPSIDERSVEGEEDNKDLNRKNYTTTLSELTKNTVYYVAYLDEDDVPSVSSDTVRSQQFSISLFDLPRIESLSVSYDYPDYTGMENQTEEPGGDIVAPVGTKINLSASLNKEVAQAVLVLNGEKVNLDAKNLKATGSFVVEKDGEYTIQLVDNKSLHNKNPLEYYIRAIEDREPEVTLRSPGKDKQVMPLEEVAFAIDANDDYGLAQFEFTYSIVGKDNGDKKIDFLSKNKQTPSSQTLSPRKIISGETTLYLEDLEVQPGDVISYFVSVTDNNGLDGPAQKISDIYFLEIIPTSREFSRANGGGSGGGGGGGGGADGSALVKIQKDVIAATWKLKNRNASDDDESFIADGKIIRDTQAEVAERAKMSISRLTERGNFENDSYQNAVIALQQSLKEMSAAIDSLDELALNKALQSEQRALQEILKADSHINRTEVASSRNQQGGGGGGQQRDNEDLRELFEMEMGELENRYELPSEAQTGQQQNNSQTSELADKFKELARRQERLTRSQRELAQRQEQMTEEQKRRQLEKLKREQEQLRQELSQLSQSLSQQQSQQQSSQSNAGQSSSQQQSQQSQQQSQQQEQQRRMQQALNQMEQAAQSESASQAAAKSQKALENIQQQAEQLSQSGQESIADLKKSIQEETDRLIQQQRKIKEDLQALSRQQGVGESRAEAMSSNAANSILEEQRELKVATDEIAKKLRTIASNSKDGESRDIQQSHQISRSLRPIQEKMDTSNMILNRGMVNLSLKLESDIESALNKLKREVSGLDGSQLASAGPSSEDQDRNKKQLAEQVSQLRQTLQSLQQQIENQNQQEGKTQNTSRSATGQQPDSQGQDQNQSTGERSNALSQQQSTSRMRNTLDQGRQIARELSQREGQANDQQGGQGGRQDGQPTASFEGARSIHEELDQQSIEDFLRRPELLEALLQPIVELDNKLKVQAELEKIDSTLFSSKDEDIPDEYKTKVENYYRVLSESKTQK